MNQMFILIEGNDDERFVIKIVKPLLLRRYAQIKTYQYAKRPKKDIERFVNIAKEKLNADLVCFSDQDNSPCVTKVKEKITTKKIGNMDAGNIVAVNRKIEGWYLAGLNSANSKKIQIHVPEKTDHITKTEFDDMVSKSKFTSRISCMSEILNCYDINIATQRNASFGYLYSKYLAC